MVKSFNFDGRSRRYNILRETHGFNDEDLLINKKVSLIFFVPPYTLGKYSLSWRRNSAIAFIKTDNWELFSGSKYRWSRKLIRNQKKKKTLFLLI